METSTVSSAAEESPTTRAQPLLLGIHAWFVASIAPHFAFEAESQATPMSVVASVGALAFLILPLFVSVRRWAVLTSALVLFPAAVAAATLGAPRPATATEALVWVVVMTASMGLYVASAARTFASSVDVRESVRRDGGSRPLTDEMARRRRIVFATVTLGGGLVAIVTPSIGGLDAYRAWGASAREAQLLTMLVAAAVATGCIAGIVGPATRAARVSRRKRSSSRWMAALPYALGAATSGCLWVAYLWLEQT